MQYKIVIKSTEKDYVYNNVKSYELIDNGNTIRFFDEKLKEYKRFPYTGDVEIIEVGE